MKPMNVNQMKNFMHSAPVNIFFKDTECRYCFVSEICESVNTGESGTILGKTDLEVQCVPELGKFYYEDDKKILATGEGSEYISEFPSADGKTVYYEIKKCAVRDAAGDIIGIVGIVDDVTERVLLEKKVEELSYKDKLTGLHNRNYMESRSKEGIRSGDFPVSMIMADCNYLKRTNDQLGHEYGDLLLRRIADAISESIPQNCVPMRVGGDEFLILCTQCSKEQAYRIVDQIKEQLAAKSDDKLSLSAAFGVSTTEEKENFSFEQAYKKADQEMYREKKKAHTAPGSATVDL